MAQPTAFPSSVVPQAPEDPLFGLMTAFRADTEPSKVDLGIGAYRDNNGQPWVLPVVRKVKQQLLNDPAANHEYLPITGLADFTSTSQKLVFGPESDAVSKGKVSSVQTISGTGALHIGGLFLARFYNKDAAERPAVYISNPTWANHRQIFSSVGLEVREYPYFSAETNGLDFDGMTATLEAAPSGSIIILHTCAHNPTGVDPTLDQWKTLADLISRKQHFPFFDTAYQGFASGDLTRDAAAIRMFADRGLELVVAQSYAKNMGLYGERVGCFHYHAPSTVSAENMAEHVKRVGSQLAILIRSEISNPPSFGARIVAKVLSTPSLFAEWEEDLRTMSGRIAEMRTTLRTSLEKAVADSSEPVAERYRSWPHITDQIGMFSFTGLSKSQVGRLRSEYHIYMTANGRVSMAGFNTGNVEYVAKAIAHVVSSGEGRL